MRTLGLSQYALTIGSAAALLAGCNGSQAPIGVPVAMQQSGAIAEHPVRGSIPQYVYVADSGLKAVIAFDIAGNKVAQKAFSNLIPADVVTDSRGHVYVDVSVPYGPTEVLEYTHNLDRRIAKYSPPGFGYTMAVDSNDNLYVESASAGGFYESIVRYPYGSTQVQRTYTILEGAPRPASMEGIAMDGKVLRTIINIQDFPPFRRRCKIDGTEPCHGDDKDTPPYGECGYTSANQYLVYGVYLQRATKVQYSTIGKLWRKDHHNIALPADYGLDAGFCNFHGYEGDVWLGVESDTQPSEVLEIDIAQGTVVTTIGAGYLETPRAAYYGNGLARGAIFRSQVR